ncbi:hypothetical protein EAS64_10480 [Trebonia kvetii]|uniref:Uncharacterized protein n=1 Tax=Trebonia kvetii TaxID=2480626 RepID=A0A6P2C1G1_9ACTN|nr:hypothetical protein [Trebonia kvetii]TVZ05038.1 hypothetical protein EAS64_10480 [Trebonia kvetii]
MLETYIVQDRWLAFAELDGDGIRLWIMRQGDVYTTRPGVSHNVYLPAYAVTHVVKHGGDGRGDDWFGDPFLDSKTKDLSEEQILANC